MSGKKSLIVHVSYTSIHINRGFIFAFITKELVAYESAIFFRPARLGLAVHSSIFAEKGDTRV
ncbi:hypothetical protein AAC03nite_08220 [Alicyclobacillus acidoterrestris]|nr:hypothetical protein AAC03nite_08220 [Alicyclobacillus acidoterrestris]